MQIACGVALRVSCLTSWPFARISLCSDCGICRVGGRDKFFHCATCNSCYAIALQQSHVCVENAMVGGNGWRALQCFLRGDRVLSVLGFWFFDWFIVDGSKVVHLHGIQNQLCEVR